MQFAWKIGRNRFYCFLCWIIVLKLALMGCFSSDYEGKMFWPFVELFLRDTASNPYETFRESYGFVGFPYPPVMLWIESVGGALASLFGHHVFLGRLCFKLPLLGFDLLCLWFLMRIYPRDRRSIGVLYFASPIILYSTYMHGQLDIIPTALFFGASACILRRGLRYEIGAALFLAAALLTKLHILAAIPLLIMYLYKRGSMRQLWMIAAVVPAAVWIICSPYAGSMDFWQSVLFNKEQALLTEVYMNIADMRVYLPVFALLLVYMQTFTIRNINRELFLGLLGILFGVFLLLLPPMPGWYVWIVPFTVGGQLYRNLFLYGMMNALYLVYFLTVHERAYLNLYYMEHALSWMHITNSVYQNLVFTLLEGSLLYVLYLLYRYSVSDNGTYQQGNRSFTIGVAGDSGTGKSTLRGILERGLGGKNVLFLEGDGDHKWERGDPEWRIYTHLHPKANWLYRQARDIALLRMGEQVCRVDYDHATGRFTREYWIKPRKYILLAGLHAFYLPQVRRVFDLKIFMDIDETLRQYWKIQRDMKKRGYSKEKILAQIQARLPDAEKYIHPQIQFADVVISYFDPTLNDCLKEHHDVILSLRFTIQSVVDLEPVVQCLSSYGVRSHYVFLADSEHQAITFEGGSLETAKIDFSNVMARCVPGLADLTQEDMAVFHNRDGIILLIIFLLVNYKMGRL